MARERAWCGDLTSGPMDMSWRRCKDIGITVNSSVVRVTFLVEHVKSPQ